MNDVYYSTLVTAADGWNFNFYGIKMTSVSKKFTNNSLLIYNLYKSSNREYIFESVKYDGGDKKSDFRILSDISSIKEPDINSDLLDALYNNIKRGILYSKHDD